MLFPLGQELQCEDIGQRVEVFDPKIETEKKKILDRQIQKEKILMVKFQNQKKIQGIKAL